ncbi:uncharacterized protein FOBCDRAFT_254266 [Fusarium oxysporum Fo47]|uniref:uncharacterized protein n=1 Tax=Fusarium oxysporum Fo47 TaxID=660027 RepID=UPI002869CA37|nr:uncharacterized protein FOBCDRAFT_254266 [Fusarium oxysporum Fo47]QKD62159.2 hypothetical protein FOBCDRAFT_254266 [Fusarium oxysporum Fo47]
MDPISAVAIAASLFSFSTSSLLLVQNFVKSGETQFLHMSLAMAQIISENDDNSFTGYRDGSHAPVVGPMTKALELPGDTRPVKQHVDRRIAFVSEVRELIANDFTRSLVLIVPNGADSFRFVTVRNKIDTGSDENFVNAELLQRHEIDPATITTIPEETREQRTLHMLNDFKFTPTQEIRLSWHKLNDMKQRESDFVIVKDAPFDVLIGSKQWQSEVKKSAFFLIGRRKSKAEKKEQKENAEKEEENAERLLKAQLEQTEELLKGRTRVNSDKSDEGSKSGRKISTTVTELFGPLSIITLETPSSVKMSHCKDSKPRQNGNQSESYPDPTHLAKKPQYDNTEKDGYPSVNDSKPTLKHTKLCRRRYLLCFIWLSAVLIYIAIEWFNLVSSADIMKLLAWKHRDDYVPSLHFKFSQVFLQYYFKVLKLKASSSTTPGNGYWGTSDMG